MVAGATTVLAGVSAAIALAAAGPGVPQTNEVGASWFASFVDGKARFCEGTDGFYAEATLHYQAPSDETASNDPRFDGLVDFYQHELLRIEFDNFDLLGHVDGTAHWFESDAGKKTATTRFMAVVNNFAGGGEGGFEGYRMQGTMGGPSGSTDGIAYAYGDLPRGDVYATFNAIEGSSEGGTAFAGQFGDPSDSPVNPGTDTTGAIVQSFNCTTKYQPITSQEPSDDAAGQGPSTNSTTAGGQQGALSGLAKLVSPADTKVTRRGRSRARVAIPSQSRWWLAQVAPKKGLPKPLADALGLLGG